MANEMRLIDANALIKQFDDSFKGFVMARIIDAQPTVDAVEVVRCKDCKYWASNGKDEILGVEDGVCCCYQWESDYFNIETTSDDFCSYGERREGE